MTATPPVSFSIGIIGNMDLTPAEIHPAKEHLRILFRLIRSKPETEQREKLLLHLNALTSCDAVCGPRPEYDNSVVEAFRRWPDLHRLPITITTNLAPGADTLAVEVALEDEFASQDFVVKAVFPYPFDLYVGQASTYNGKTKDGSPDPSNEPNKAKFNEIIRRIGAQNQIVLRKAGEEKIDDGAFYSKCKEELDSDISAARHSRYYAAGEFIAVNCHLMIAFWDSDFDKDTDNGTGALVFARRFGPRQNVLPTTSSLALPHGGPLVHIPVRRSKNESMKDTPLSAPAIRVLHPFPYTSEIKQGVVVGASQLSAISDVESQKSGSRVLRSVLENLVWFDECKKPGFGELVTEQEKRLTEKTCDSLKEAEPAAFESMALLLETRKTATGAQSRLEPVSRLALIGMFWLVAIAAILFHLFAEWHPQDRRASSTDQSAQHVNADESHDSNGVLGDLQGPSAVHRDGFRPWLGVFSGLAAGCGIVTYLMAKTSRRREHADDVRSLAEGLRVQFYWNITGVGRSVPANYSLRQRSELDWIRSVIRGTSAPYDQWTRWFDHLARPSQIQLLRACLKGWIIDQEKYFREGSEKKHQELHFWHRTGVVFAWAGVCIAICLVLLNFRGSRLLFLQENAWFAASFIPVFAVIVLVLATLIHALRPRSDAHSHSNPFKGFVWSGIFKFVSLILPFEDEHTDGPRVSLSVRNFFVGLPCVLLLAYSGMVLTAWLANIPLPVPDAFTLSSVLSGAFLLAGGLLIAWGEKQLLSETGYQFNTMASLFRSARIQYEKYLSDFEKVALLVDDPAAQEKAQAMLIQIQDFIYELGREALDENAEWLILHRARPLEPVMAG